jgi:glycosyltransferase involved in cell wall biosynthesis
VIAGNIPDGPEHAHYFSSEIQPHLCDMIQYVGAVDDTQKNELLGSALAMIMAIEWNEPFGIVMAEALACGTPVLGTPLGAVPEVVIDNKTGFVRSVEELGAMVQQVPLLDRKDCRESCEERFSDSVVASNYFGLYQRLLDRDTRRR